jgi:hypothetical protein
MVDRFAFVGESRAAADDECTGNAREVGRETLGNAVDEILLFAIAADVSEGQHHDGDIAERTDGF